MTGGFSCRTLGAAMACVIWSEAGFAQTGAQSADCDCRASGRMWAQGVETCIQGQLHICGMNQNVSAWISTQKSCPTARMGRRVSGFYADSAFFSSARSE